MEIIVAYLLAVFIWNCIPEKKIEIAGLTNKQLQKIQTPTQSTKLSALKIFGNSDNVPQEVSVVSSGSSVKRTKLNINITGISASSDEKKGAVSLIFNNVEDTFGVGDKLPKSNAIIARILPNKIIINNGGIEEEVLFMDEDIKLSPTKTSSNSNTPINSKPEEIKEEMKLVRTELISNPGSLLNYLNIKPAMADGKMIGYELNPGNDNKLFINSGLRAGDIAVEINGRDLTNNAEAMKVIGELQNATELNIVIDRNGSKENIFLDLK